jgi:hypothetical protein
MSAMGEFCRYAPAKGRKVSDRLLDLRNHHTFGSQRTSDERNSRIERVGRLCSLQAGTLAGPGGAGVQDSAWIRRRSQLEAAPTRET